MKVKELIEKLQAVDPDLEVFCPSATGDYDHGRVYTADIRPLSIDEDFETEVLCFVIDEQ